MRQSNLNFDDFKQKCKEFAHSLERVDLPRKPSPKTVKFEDTGTTIIQHPESCHSLASENLCKTQSIRAFHDTVMLSLPYKNLQIQTNDISISKSQQNIQTPNNQVFDHADFSTFQKQSQGIDGESPDAETPMVLEQKMDFGIEQIKEDVIIVTDPSEHEQKLNTQSTESKKYTNKNIYNQGRQSAILGQLLSSGPSMKQRQAVRSQRLDNTSTKKRDAHRIGDSTVIKQQQRQQQQMVEAQSKTPYQSNGPMKVRKFELFNSIATSKEQPKKEKSQGKTDILQGEYCFANDSFQNIGNGLKPMILQKSNVVSNNQKHVKPNNHIAQHRPQNRSQDFSSKYGGIDMNKAKKRNNNNNILQRSTISKTNFNSSINSRYSAKTNTKAVDMPRQMSTISQKQTNKVTAGSRNDYRNMRRTMTQNPNRSTSSYHSHHSSTSIPRRHIDSISANRAAVELAQKQLFDSIKDKAQKQQKEIQDRLARVNIQRPTPSQTRQNPITNIYKTTQSRVLTKLSQPIKQKRKVDAAPQFSIPVQRPGADFSQYRGSAQLPQQIQRNSKKKTQTGNKKYKQTPVMGISDQVKLLKRGVAVLPSHLDSIETLSIHAQSYNSYVPIRQDIANKRLQQQTFGDKVKQQTRSTLTLIVPDPDEEEYEHKEQFLGERNRSVSHQNLNGNYLLNQQVNRPRGMVNTVYSPTGSLSGASVVSFKSQISKISHMTAMRNPIISTNNRFLKKNHDPYNRKQCITTQQSQADIISASLNQDLDRVVPIEKRIVPLSGLMKMPMGKNLKSQTDIAQYTTNSGSHMMTGSTTHRDIQRHNFADIVSSVQSCVQRSNNDYCVTRANNCQNLTSDHSQGPLHFDSLHNIDEQHNGASQETVVDNGHNLEDGENNECFNLKVGGRLSDDQGSSPRNNLRMWEKVQKEQNTNIRQRIQSNSSLIKRSRDSRSRQRQIQQAKCKNALQVLSQDDENDYDQNPEEDLYQNYQQSQDDLPQNEENDELDLLLKDHEQGLEQVKYGLQVQLSEPEIQFHAQDSKKSSDFAQHDNSYTQQETQSKTDLDSSVLLQNGHNESIESKGSFKSRGSRRRSRSGYTSSSLHHRKSSSYMKSKYDAQVAKQKEKFARFQKGLRFLNYNFGNVIKGYKVRRIYFNNPCIRDRRIEFRDLIQFAFMLQNEMNDTNKDFQEVEIVKETLHQTLIDIQAKREEFREMFTLLHEGSDWIKLSQPRKIQDILYEQASQFEQTKISFSSRKQLQLLRAGEHDFDDDDFNLDEDDEAQYDQSCLPVQIHQQFAQHMHQASMEESERQFAPQPETDMPIRPVINTDLSPSRAHVLSAVSPMDLANQFSTESLEVVQNYSSPPKKQHPAQVDVLEQRQELQINDQALEITQPSVERIQENEIMSPCVVKMAKTPATQKVFVSKIPRCTSNTSLRSNSRNSQTRIPKIQNHPKNYTFEFNATFNNSNVSKKQEDAGTKKIDTQNNSQCTESIQLEAAEAIHQSPFTSFDQNVRSKKKSADIGAFMKETKSSTAKKLCRSGKKLQSAERVKKYEIDKENSDTKSITKKPKFLNPTISTFSSGSRRRSRGDRRGDRSTKSMKRLSTLKSIDNLPESMPQEIEEPKLIEDVSEHHLIDLPFQKPTLKTESPKRETEIKQVESPVKKHEDTLLQLQMMLQSQNADKQQFQQLIGALQRQFESINATSNNTQ